MKSTSPRVVVAALAILLLVSTWLLGGCLGTDRSRPAPAETKLTLSVVTYPERWLDRPASDKLPGQTTSYSLSCPDSKGSLPDANRACRLLKTFTVRELDNSNNPGRPLFAYREARQPDDFTEIRVSGRLHGRPLTFAGDFHKDHYRRWYDIIGEAAIQKLQPSTNDKRTVNLQIIIQRSSKTASGRARQQSATYILACPEGSSWSGAQNVCRRLKRLSVSDRFSDKFVYAQLQSDLAQPPGKYLPFKKRTPPINPSTTTEMFVSGVMDGQLISLQAGTQARSQQEYASYLAWHRLLGRLPVT